MGRTLERVVDAVADFMYDATHPKALDTRAAKTAYNDVLDKEVAKGKLGKYTHGVALHGAAAAVVGYVTGNGALKTARQYVTGVQGPATVLHEGFEAIRKMSGRPAQTFEDKTDMELKMTMYLTENPKTFAKLTAGTAVFTAASAAGMAYVSKKLGMNINPRTMAKVGAAASVIGSGVTYAKGKKLINKLKGM